MDQQRLEAIQVMNRCKQEILALRAVIARLEPKANAYDNLACVLRFVPGPSIPTTEGMVWLLDKHIRALAE